MTELAVVRLRTIVRLGEALPVVFFSSAVDFILAEPRHAAPPVLLDFVITNILPTARSYVLQKVA